MHQHEDEFNFVGGEITLEVDQIVLLRFWERRETRVREEVAFGLVSKGG